MEPDDPLLEALKESTGHFLSATALFFALKVTILGILFTELFGYFDRISLENLCLGELGSGPIKGIPVVTII